jgi:hypothetical protein
VNAGFAALRHPQLPLERVARHRGAALPAAWMPRVQRLAAEEGGMGEPRGTRLVVLLPDPLRDRAFADAVRATFDEGVDLGPPRVRSGDGPFALRPVMAYAIEVPLRFGGAVRGELHRRGADPDVFDVKLHAAQARGRAPLDALLGLDAWVRERAGDDAVVRMTLAAWEPGDPGPRAA